MLNPLTQTDALLGNFRGLSRYLLPLQRIKFCMLSNYGTSWRPQVSVSGLGQVCRSRQILLCIVFCVKALLVCTASSSAPAQTACALPHDRNVRPHLARTVTVFVAGDVMLGRGSVSKLQRHQTPLQWLTPQSRAADIAFCNLECVLTHTSREQRWKLLLFAAPSAANYLSDAGISVVSTANNHTFDAGDLGVSSTLEALRKAGIASIGTDRSRGNWPVWERAFGNTRIAWLAASVYGPWQKGRTRMRNAAGSGLTDQVRFLTKTGAVVFVSLHWGNEYSRIPTEGQKQLAHKLIDAGAAAVVGHHPHVAQPVEVYRGRPIFYSLGNFVFDHRRDQTQDGMAALISVLPSGTVSFRLLPLLPPRQKPPREQQVPPAPLPVGEKLIKMLPGHFLKEESGPQIIVWSTNPHGSSVLRAFVRRPGYWHCLAEGHHPQIFDMQVGDVNHDGQEEVILGLFQRAKLDIHTAPRLYIYSIGKTGLFEPLWRGSGLSRSFRHFWLLPSLNGADIVALEKDGQREYRRYDWLSVYRWNGFGLRRLWTTPILGSVQNVCTGQGREGAFITLTQVLPDSRRNLILRPVSGYNALSDNQAEFVSQVVEENHKPTLNHKPILNHKPTLGSQKREVTHE